jgi:hypothetical protein
VKAPAPIMPDKGKVERPFSYIREDFYLARSFRNIDDLNAQLGHWLGTVANPRLHATTRRVVNEAFAEEKPALQPLPLVPFRAVLKLERRVSHEGMVSNVPLKDGQVTDLNSAGEALPDDPRTRQ